MYYLKYAPFICLVVIGIVLAKHHEEHQKPHYYFEYGVDDPHTHDHKSHYEHRDGDHVHGAYTLKEPDGTTRIVRYTVGPKTGFQAHVERIGHAHHPHGGHSHHGVQNGGGHGEEHLEDDHEGEGSNLVATWGPFGF